MKWSMPLKSPLDLKTVRFLAMRYRGRGLAPWNDYCVWLGGEAEGKGVEASAISLSQCAATASGTPRSCRSTWRSWQIIWRCRLPGQDRGELAIRQITFSSDKPAIGPADVLPSCRGHDQSILAAGHFACVDLAAAAKQAADDIVEEWGVTQWFDCGKLTVRGIPFDLPAGSRILSTLQAIRATFPGRP